MPKRARELGPLEVKRLARPGLHAVGGVAGLALQITASGARSWLFRYRFNGRRREAGLGPFPDVPLAKARDYAREARDLLWQGIDPIDHRLAAKRQQKTLAEAAELFAEQKAVEFRSAVHRKQWRASLERHVLPTLGEKAVADIDFQDVLKVLQPIWTEKTETASKVRQRLERVLDFSTVSGHRKGENPARWRGNLDMVLPAPTKLTGGRNYPSLQLADAARWHAALRARSGMSARALEFQALTAARTGAVLLQLGARSILTRSSGLSSRVEKPQRYPHRANVIACP